MIAPAIAQTATQTGLTTPREASRAAETRAISPGSGMPSDSSPMISATRAYTAPGGTPSIQASMCSKASTSVAGRDPRQARPGPVPVPCGSRAGLDSRPNGGTRPLPERAA